MRRVRIGIMPYHEVMMVYCLYKSGIAEVIRMYEYKVESYKVRYAETGMNMLAKEGWRVIAVSPDIAKAYGVVVTYEREKNDTNFQEE